MRKLTRPIKPPRCILRAQDAGSTNWQRLRGKDRREIWVKLNEMQHRICAYCERAFSEDDSHIEHLYPRAKYEGLTFEWKNLFGSCNSQYSCGIYKDSTKNPHQVDHELLIKPDQDDPTYYFRYYKNGRMSIRPRLSDAEYLVARETILAFNLNHRTLVSLRQHHLSPLVQLEEEFILWCDLCEEHPEMEVDLAAEIRSLLIEQVDTPFQSIKQHYIREHLDLLGLVSDSFIARKGGASLQKSRKTNAKSRKKTRKKRYNRHYNNRTQLGRNSKKRRTKNSHVSRTKKMRSSANSRQK